MFSRNFCISGFWFFFFAFISVTRAFTLLGVEVPISSSYSIGTSWQDGYTINLQITNSSSNPVLNWECGFDLPDGQSINSLWNGDYSSSSQHIVITNSSHNGWLNPGESANLGFQVSNPRGTISQLKDIYAFGAITGSDVNGFQLETSYTISNIREQGFQVDIYLKNNTSKPSTAWVAEFDLPEGAVLAAFWNGRFSADGSHVRVNNPAWKGGGVINPGEDHRFGLTIQTTDSSVPNQIGHLSALANESQIRPAGVPEAPVLNPVFNPSWNPSYILTWQSSNYANSYVLQQDTDQSFSNPTVVYEGQELSKKIEGASPGTYYYRVSANNEFGSSPYSESQSVVVTHDAPLASPVLATIYNPHESSTYVLQWSIAGKEASYIVEESTTYDFIQGRTIYSGKDNFYAVAKPEAGTYYYRVIAVKGQRESSPSNIESTNVAATFLDLVSSPILYPIYNPDHSGSYTVSWVGVDNAAEYTLEESFDKDFIDSIVIYAGKNKSVKFVNKTSGHFFYRVKAKVGVQIGNYSNMEGTLVNTEPSKLADISQTNIVAAFEGFFWSPADPIRKQSIMYSAQQRNLLLSLLKSFGGYNTYIFAPQFFDSLASWSDKQWKDFENSSKTASANGIRFVYGLRPGWLFGDEAEKTQIIDKLNDLASVGITHYSLHFDDVNGGDLPSQKELQVELANFLEKQFPEMALVLFVPSAYSRSLVQDNWEEDLSIFAEGLSPDVVIGVTGSEIVPSSMDPSKFPQNGRRYLFIDNWIAVDSSKRLPWSFPPNRASTLLSSKAFGYALNLCFPLERCVQQLYVVSRMSMGESPSVTEACTVWVNFLLANKFTTAAKRSALLSALIDATNKDKFYPSIQALVKAYPAMEGVWE